MSSIELREGKGRQNGRSTISLLASGEVGAAKIEMSQRKGKEHRFVRLSSAI